MIVLKEIINKVFEK